MVEKIDFQTGIFFTFLPSDADLDRIYEFAHGGIIPSVPYGDLVFGIEGYPMGFQPQKIITMDQECSEFISSFLKKQSENHAVVENYMLESDSPHAHFNNVEMIPFQKEVYFFLRKTNSVKEIYQTIRKSVEPWHSLIVLTQFANSIPSVLEDNVLNQICENAKFIIAGAYDEEGYIYWERREGA